MEKSRAITTVCSRWPRSWDSTSSTCCRTSGPRRRQLRCTRTRKADTWWPHAASITAASVTPWSPRAWSPCFSEGAPELTPSTGDATDRTPHGSIVRRQEELTRLRNEVAPLPAEERPQLGPRNRVPEKVALALVAAEAPQRG